MALRYLDTNFYKSPFIRGLKGSLKGLYTFIICDCTGAGIWAKDLQIASAYIGHEITEKDFEIFVTSGKLIDLNNGKFFFHDFVQHQYPKGFSDKNPAQNNFIKELQSYGLLDDKLQIDLSKYQVPSKTLQRVTSNGNRKSNSNGNGNSKPETEIIFPFNSAAFMSAWSLWKQYKKEQFNFAYKQIGEQAALKDLASISGGIESTAIYFIENAIAKNWKGIYKPSEQKQNNNERIYTAEDFKD